MTRSYSIIRVSVLGRQLLKSYPSYGFSWTRFTRDTWFINSNKYNTKQFHESECKLKKNNIKRILKYCYLFSFSNKYHLVYQVICTYHDQVTCYICCVVFSARKLDKYGERISLAEGLSSGLLAVRRDTRSFCK